MNIIYQLPFPDKICSKIVLYAFKSPHIHLQEEIFKRDLSHHLPQVYQKLVEKGGLKRMPAGILSRCRFLTTTTTTTAKADTFIISNTISMMMRENKYNLMSKN